MNRREALLAGLALPLAGMAKVLKSDPGIVEIRRRHACEISPVPLMECGKVVGVLTVDIEKTSQTGLVHWNRALWT